MRLTQTKKIDRQTGNIRSEQLCSWFLLSNNEVCRSMTSCLMCSITPYLDVFQMLFEYQGVKLNISCLSLGRLLIQIYVKILVFIIDSLYGTNGTISHFAFISCIDRCLSFRKTESPARSQAAALPDFESFLSNLI